MPLYYTKLTILCIVTTLQTVALRWGSVPYFPIEISRTAQASIINQWVFPIASVLLPLVMVQTNEWDNKYIPSLFGLILLAYFDDKTHLVMHQIGVVIMVFCALNVIIYAPDYWNRFMLFLCALALLLTRIVLKVFIVSTVELGSYSPQAIMMKSIQIMYDGAYACQYPQYTIPIFQLGGLLQWVTFYLILCSIE
jgi:hypothetical protein